MKRIEVWVAAIVLSAALAATLAMSGVARASVGTGIGANPLRLASPAEPGGRYRLPSVLVVNTGTQSSTYVMQVKRLGQPDAHAIPSSWVRFARTKVKLRPHKRAVIPVVLTVPKGAPQGAYGSNVVVSTYTPRPGGGAALGAAAADELSFAIRPSSSSLLSRSWFRDLLLALAATGLAVLVVRRSGLQLRIERQRR